MCSGSPKGQRVLVVGRMEIGEWTTRENEVRTSYDIWADDIWADDVVNLSPREDGGVPRASGATRTHRRSCLPRVSRPAARLLGSTIYRSDRVLYLSGGGHVAWLPQVACLRLPPAS
jgi:hypothetical protein